MSNTIKEILNITENLNFKGYDKHFHRNTNGDYNHKQNFFIWKKKGKKEYLRIALMESFHKPKYWSVDFNFKPFNIKKCDKWKSDFINTEEEEINYFKKAIKEINIFIKVKGGLKKDE